MDLASAKPVAGLQIPSQQVASAPGSLGAAAPSRSRRPPSLPPHPVAPAGRPRCRRPPSLPPAPLAAAGFLIRRTTVDYKSRLSKRVPPQHRTFSAQQVLPPPDSLAAAGFPIRRARALPHHSARRGKPVSQIPPQQRTFSAQQVLPPPDSLAAAGLPRCRRISNPAHQGGITNPASARSASARSAPGGTMDLPSAK